MSAKIAIGMASVNAPALLDRCLKSCVAQSGIVHEDIMVVQNGPTVGWVCTQWESLGVHVHRPKWNTGTCRSWNYICRRAFALGYDAALIINDDMELIDPETIRKYQARYDEQLGLRQFIYLKDRGYSAVSVTRPIWDEAGPFDEAIWPGYFCDNEHHYRVGLAGFPTDHLIVETNHAGSASLRQDQGFADAISVAFQLNGEYFRKKWGGTPKAETFTVPFNGGEPVRPTLERLPPNIRAILECRYA